MPLIRRIPKRGFQNIFAQDVATVNVSDLDRFPEGSVVTPALLVQHRLLRKRHQTVKVLGNGDLKKKLVVEAHAFSAGARAKIEAAGGRAEELKG
jgi:large subunit ribosomal protein L15